MENDQEIFKSIINEIDKADHIICIKHINPDGDALGSQMGLKKLILKNWKNKKVYSIGKTYEVYKNLGKIDIVDDELFKKALVIITDTGPINRIEDSRWKLANKVIKMDHHPNDNSYGDIQWADSSFTSASEMIGYFALKNNLEIDADIARTILYGITTDSNRFYASNVSSRTFDVCSFLMKPKWNIVDLYQDIYSKDILTIKAQGDVIKNMIAEDGVGAVFLTQEMIEEYKIPYDQNDIFVNLLQGVNGVEIYVSFSANEDGTYRVEFRSVNIPIKSVAEKYGGGGHALIAGATIKSLEISKNIISDLKKCIK